MHALRNPYRLWVYVLSGIGFLSLPLVALSDVRKSLLLAVLLVVAFILGEWISTPLREHAAAAARLDAAIRERTTPVLLYDKETDQLLYLPRKTRMSAAVVAIDAGKVRPLVDDLTPFHSVSVPARAVVVCGDIALSADITEQISKGTTCPVKVVEPRARRMRMLAMWIHVQRGALRSLANEMDEMTTALRRARPAAASSLFA